MNANGGAINGAIANNAGGRFNVGGTVTSDSTFDNQKARWGRTLAIMAAGDYTVDGAHHQQRRHHRGERRGVPMTATLRAGEHRHRHRTVNADGEINDDLEQRRHPQHGTAAIDNGATWNGNATNTGGGDEPAPGRRTRQVRQHSGTLSGLVTPPPPPRRGRLTLLHATNGA